MRALALLLSLLVAVPAHAQSPFIFGGGGQAKALNSNGITLKTGQTLNYDGPENWIKNGGAEDPTVVSITTYDDGAAAEPVDCTGGTASEISAAAITTTTPIKGNARYSFVKSAADAQGQGWAIEFTLPTANPAASYAWAAEFAMWYLTGSNYVAADMGVYIYDVNGSGGLQKVGDIGASSSLGYTTNFPTWITTGGGVTTYRACLHIQTTNASSYSLGADNIYAGIEKSGPVPVMPYESGIAWTPTGTFSSNATYSGFYNKRDNLFSGTAYVSFSGATTGTNATINLPTGLNVDESRLAGGSGTFHYFGDAYLHEDNTNRFFGKIGYVRNGTTGVLSFRSVEQSANTVTTLNRGFSAVSDTSPFTIKSGSYITLRFADIPIAEWASSVNASPGPPTEFSCDDGSGDVFGPNGCLVPNQTIGTQVDRVVTITNPSAIDDIEVEYLDGSFPGRWMKAEQIYPFIPQSSKGFGVRGFWSADNTYTVRFGNGGILSNNATYAGDSTVSWADKFGEGDRYRLVRKGRGNNVYAMAGQDKAGLVEAGQVPGTNTNDNAATGFVGEYVENGTPRSSPVSLTTTTTVNVGSISLTAGDWDVGAIVGFDKNAATSVTAQFMGVSLTSATIPTTDVLAYPSGNEVRLQWSRTATTADTILVTYAVPNYRVTLSSTTTLYLVARSDFTVNTQVAYGKIWARRVR